MPLKEDVLPRLGALIQEMLADAKLPGPSLTAPRGEAVVAGNIQRRGPEHPLMPTVRAGVLFEDEDPCLVLLSRRLAVAYGLVPPRVPPAPGDIELEPPAGPDEPREGPLHSVLYYPGAADDGICVWDPVTGRIECEPGGFE